MTIGPSITEALEAYLAVGQRKVAWPRTEYERLVELVGADAPRLREELDALLEPLLDLPDSWKHEPLERLGDLASSRAARLHPEFSEALSEEIGRYFTYAWK